MNHWLYLENTNETFSSPYIIYSTPTKSPTSQHNAEFIVTSNEDYSTNQCARNMNHVKGETQNPPSKQHSKKVQLTSWVDKKNTWKKSHEVNHNKYAIHTPSF